MVAEEEQGEQRLLACSIFFPCSLWSPRIDEKLSKSGDPSGSPAGIFGQLYRLFLVNETLFIHPRPRGMLAKIHRSIETRTRGPKYLSSPSALPYHCAPLLNISSVFNVDSINYFIRYILVTQIRLGRGIHVHVEAVIHSEEFYNLKLNNFFPKGK